MLKLILVILVTLTQQQNTTLQCFYQTKSLYGSTTTSKVNYITDKTLLDENVATKQDPRVVRIRYCWNSQSVNRELIGVQVTVGVQGQKNSSILLNPIGTVTGSSCSTFTPQDNEWISQMQLIYTTDQVHAIVLRTSLGASVLMGSFPLKYQQSPLQQFPDSYIFIGFHGTTDGVVPKSLGYVSYWVSGCHVDEPTPDPVPEPDPVDNSTVIEQRPIFPEQAETPSQSKTTTIIVVTISVAVAVICLGSLAVYCCYNKGQRVKKVPKETQKTQSDQEPEYQLKEDYIDEEVLAIEQNLKIQLQKFLNEIEAPSNSDKKSKAKQIYKTELPFEYKKEITDGFTLEPQQSESIDLTDKDAEQLAWYPESGEDIDDKAPGMPLSIHSDEETDAQMQEATLQQQEAELLCQQYEQECVLEESKCTPYQYESCGTLKDDHSIQSCSDWGQIQKIQLQRKQLESQRHTILQKITYKQGSNDKTIKRDSNSLKQIDIQIKKTDQILEDTYKDLKKKYVQGERVSHSSVEMRHSVEMPQSQYETKNYLKAHFIDDEWIDVLAKRNQNKPQLTKDQRKILVLKQKIATRTKTGDLTIADHDKLLTLKLQYGLPVVMRKVKQLGYEFVKSTFINSPKKVLDSTCQNSGIDLSQHQLKSSRQNESEIFK